MQCSLHCRAFQGMRCQGMPWLLARALLVHVRWAMCWQAAGRGCTSCPHLPVQGTKLEHVAVPELDVYAGYAALICCWPHNGAAGLSLQGQVAARVVRVVVSVEDVVQLPAPVAAPPVVKQLAQVLAAYSSSTFSCTASDAAAHWWWHACMHTGGMHACIRKPRYWMSAASRQPVTPAAASDLLGHALQLHWDHNCPYTHPWQRQCRETHVARPHWRAALCIG
jgi:hypothetical protein